MATKRKAVSTFEGRDVPAMRPEMRKLSMVHEYPNNPRTHPPAQLAMLAELIKKHGFDQPVVVDEEGTIIKGHGRKLAAMLAGLDEVPVIVHRNLSDAEKMAMRIQDNAVSLLSGWDKELVRGEIVQLQAMDYDVKLLGFGDTQLVQFTTLPGPPGQFPAVGENLPVSYCCPRCKFQWSGDPMAGTKKGGKKGKTDDDSVRMRVRRKNG
jgi:hypothetical protein